METKLLLELKVNLEGVFLLKKYESPQAVLLEFGTSRFDTASSRCDCYTERWNYTSYNLDDDPSLTPNDNCVLETKAFIEIANAEIFNE